MKYIEEVKTYKRSLQTTNVAKTPRNSHFILITTYNRLTGNTALDTLNYNNFRNCYKSINAKNICISSSKSSWPCEVHGWNLTCHNPEEELFPRQRNSPNTQTKGHRCLWHQCHITDPGPAESPGAVSASTKSHQFLCVDISCVKKMLNPLWNNTNAPAVNTFAFCSLQDQKRVIWAQWKCHSMATLSLYHSLIQHRKWNSSRSCQSLCDSPHWNHHRREAQL